jgi:hypothetical protein
VALNLGAHQLGDLARLGMAAERLLAEDKSIVDFYFKAAAAGWKQRQAGDII